MAFIESPRFPDEIAAWLVGGRGFKTIIVETYGGDEFRNAAWSIARGEWDVAEALRTIPDKSLFPVKSLYSFFMNARGQLNAFRVTAPFDNYTESGGVGVLGSTGLAVAATTAYQMYKNYVSGSQSYQMPVLKPTNSPDAVQVYKNGVLQTLTTDYTIDLTTGIVTFTSQPSIGVTLRWVGYYDIPVRFGGDLPNIGLDSSGALTNWNGLKLIEVRNP